MLAGKLWFIAYRDLLRNRRRSVLSLLAVALGLALLIVFNGLVAGIWNDALENNIRLKTGHLQVRAPSYDDKKLSLKWDDLLDNADALAARLEQMDDVQSATPVLWIGAILTAGDESLSLQLYGIDPASSFYAPIRESMVGGTFITPDDRNGIIMGRRLADSLGVQTGDRVNLALVNADGKADEAIFTVRGLFATGIVSYDESTVFMPLDKARAFTRAGNRASAVVALLHRQEDTDRIAATLQGQNIAIRTWEEANQLIIQTVDTAMGFYVILDAIVMLIVAVIIANTLLMAVFERIREIGILAALGLKKRQIMQMFLVEAAILGLAGVAVGVVIGLAGVAYLSQVGIPLGAAASAAGSGFPLRSVMYARFAPGLFAALSFWTLVFVLLASLYPARFAARQEPVDALRAL